MGKFALLLRSSLLLICSFNLIGCLDEEKKMSAEEIEVELKGVGFDQERNREYLEESREKLAALKKMERDVDEISLLQEEFGVIEKSLAKLTIQVDELKGYREESQFEFEKYQATYRKKVRKEIVGQKVDLSTTKGDEFRSVQVVSVNPLGIKIYTSSGPRAISLDELPADLKERLQMDKAEADAYLARQKAKAELRAEKYAEWKKGLSARKGEAAQKAITKRLKDIQKEVEAIEDEVNLRLLKIKDLKSRASQWEQDFAKAQSDKRRAKALKISEIYRDQAQAITNQNSDAFLEIARLRAEEEDLKGLQTPGR